MSSDPQLIRLPSSLFAAAERLAAVQSIDVEQVVAAAVAEKVGDEYWRTRAQNASRERTVAILARAGVGQPPMPGDEVEE